MKTCNICKQTKPYTNFFKRKASKDGYAYTCKECQQTVTSNWRKDNTQRHNDLNEKLNNSIPAGVYEILYKGKRKYVGQSKKPYRRIHADHFVKFKNLDVAYKLSPVSYKLSIGEIKRKYLSYNMLDYINDENDREKVEQRYIDNSTGLWNTIHN